MKTDILEHYINYQTESYNEFFMISHFSFENNFGEIEGEEIEYEFIDLDNILFNNEEDDYYFNDLDVSLQRDIFILARLILGELTDYKHEI